MADPSQQPIPMQAASSSSDAASMTDERSSDIELGFECANPWLQIESWEQDASGKAGFFS